MQTHSTSSLLHSSIEKDERNTSALAMRGRAVKLLLLDVDGVLTDGGIYFSEQGESLKRFSTLDGHGIKLLQQAGIGIAVISGRDSAPLRLRLQNLGVAHQVLGTEDKLPAATALLTEMGVTWQECAAMGDDWPDLPLLRRVALACCPGQAHEEVQKVVHYVTRAPAGAGAVREVCDMLLKATGRYDEALERYAG